MITKRRDNIIPRIHRFITSDHGENYWFCGCGRYVMGAVREMDYDYEFFAGLTGDVFAQVYPYDRFRGDGVTDYHMSTGDSAFVEGIFQKCGYAASFIPEKQLKEKSNRDTYLQELISYIDKGIPVISNLEITGHSQWIVFVGYEDYGKALLFMSDNMTEPESVSADDVFGGATEYFHNGQSRGWIFIGGKIERKDLAQIYREAITALPELLTTKTDTYCFGAEAFRVWAEDIEKGKFDGMEPGEFNDWHMHGTYVCNGATNACCCHEFLRRARELNPDMEYLEAVSGLYRKMERMWNGDTDSLEALGGGFNVTLSVLQNEEKRGKIASKLREFAECADDVVRIIRERG